MKRFAVLFFLVFVTISPIVAGPLLAQGNPPVPPPGQGPPAPLPVNGTPGEFAVSDACGYSRNTRPGDTEDALTVKTDYIIPEGWEACRKCLYPGTTNVDDPDAKQTVKIDPVTGKAPTPAIGRYHTAIGCISAVNFRTFGSASGLIQPMLNVLFGVSGGVAFIFIILGSFHVLTSRADPERLSHGKRMLVGAIIGLLFSMGAVFIVNFVAGTILKIPGFGQ